MLVSARLTSLPFARGLAPLIALLICSCAHLRKVAPSHIPETEAYAYEDRLGNQYRLNFKDGYIADTSYVFQEDGKLAQKMVWKGGAPPQGKAPPCSVLFKIGNPPPLPDSSDRCLLAPPEKKVQMHCARSTAILLEVIRAETPELKPIHSHFLAKRRFEGKVTLYMRISPDGTVGNVYLVGNTSGFRDFGVEVLRRVNRWTFPAIESREDEFVTVPFTFSPE